jgi:hypothetical protein
MSFESFKPPVEAKPEESEKEEKVLNPEEVKEEESEKEEKVLNPEEVKELVGEMTDYTTDLKKIIDEKKEELKTKKGKECVALEAEIKELEAEYKGLTEMASGDFEEEMTIKDRK